MTQALVRPAGRASSVHLLDHGGRHRPQAGRRKREDADGQIATRDNLNLTVSLDHNMIDAAPGARFPKRLKELIESGYGLTLDEEAIAEPITRQRVPGELPQ